MYAEEIIELSDERPPFINNQGADSHQAVGDRMDSGYIAWQRLRTDNRKWIIGKLLPKKYGETKAVAVAATDEQGKQVGIQVILGKGDTAD